MEDGAAAWDERYTSAGRLWSGRPNHSLVATVEAGGVAAGRALDVGCGEGGDAVWLARRGWRVTGVDISAVALRRAADAADAAAVGDRVTWTQADVASADLPAGAWDLVNAQYLQLRPDDRARLWPALAARVAPGGILLVAAHDRSDPHVAAHLADHDRSDPHVAAHLADHDPVAGPTLDADRFHAAGEVVEALGAGWELRRAGPARWTRPGEPEGAAVDVVVEAVRLPR